MAGALAGTTVLELTRVSPGSFCTMLLADMGADVLKIETPPALSPESGSGMSGGPVSPLGPLERARRRAPRKTM